MSNTGEIILTILLSIIWVAFMILLVDVVKKLLKKDEDNTNLPNN